MKNAKPAARSRIWEVSLLLVIVLACLFWRSFLPGFVHFSNDGPLGMQNAAWMHMPEGLTGQWYDLNSIGLNHGMFPPSLTFIILWMLGPVGYAKFLAPVALLIIGLGACFFFRKLKLSPLAVALGALAGVLNSVFFTDACWGVASHEIALGMVFFALGLIVANTAETPPLTRWVRLALAGLCVGMNVVEAVDIGALYSLFVAAFVFFKSVFGEEGVIAKKLVRGVGSVVIVAVFAGFIALQTVLSLVGTQIQGIAGHGQDEAAKAANWDFATQWSEPKLETLGLFVPGLFGYKMDTPQGMMPAFQDAYRGGVYWGGMGRSPALDRYFDSGQTGTPPPGTMRLSGGGSYCGILVALIAAWAIAQSFRRKNPPFTAVQKKFIWFWTGVMFVSLLLSWGRFAPMFYGVFYQVPYFSTIRNPAKFIIFLSWAMVILFGYGVHLLSRRHLEIAAAKSTSLSGQLKNWWAKATSFDRKWTFACLGILGISVLGWLLYVSEKPALVSFLQARGFPDEDFAGQIATFSIHQAGWWLVIFAVAIGLLTLVVSGYFAGARAKWGGLLLGAFLVLDLSRADLPYIIHWNYIQKYDIDPANASNSTNPVINFLRNQPYEHRVAMLPFESQQHLRDDDDYFGGSGVYRIEWAQHHFLYYNIQSLDIIQMPRTPVDLEAFDSALAFSSPARRWELTNTRYLLGPAGFLVPLNEQLDPVQQRFHIALRFDIVPKPDITQHITELAQLTAVTNSDGDLALFNFAGALPRAKLYSNWQIAKASPAALQQWVKTIQQHVPQEMGNALAQCSTNDLATLHALAGTNFDAWKTVLVTAPLPSSPLAATNENAGTVEYKSYAPKHIVFAANATNPSVLLLNDKYDPNWHVTVDGQPAELLRCNFIMRGVYLPAGQHTVVFQFTLPDWPLKVTLAAIGLGIFLAGLLVFLSRKSQTAAAK
jgi:hypothetical protein